MSLIFEILAPNVVAKSIRDAREEADRTRIKVYDKHEAFYIGGAGKNTDPRTIEWLWKHAAESPVAWTERQRRYTHWGYTGTIGGALVASLTGDTIIREIGKPESREQMALEEVLKQSRWDSGQRMIGQSVVVAGDAFVNINFSTALNRLRLLPVDPGNVFVEVHEDDPTIEKTLVEVRPVDAEGKKIKAWVWQDEQVMLVDQDGRPYDLPWPKVSREGWHTNPYGVIPYVHYRGLPMIGEYWGISPIRDVVELNELLNNRASQSDRVCLMQAHKQLVVSDSATLGEKLTFGESNALVLGSEGKAELLGSNPEGITVLEGSLLALVERMFEIGGVPISIIRGGSASSGLQLMIEYRRMEEIVNDLKIEYAAAEGEVIRRLCRIGRVHGLPFPENPEVAIDMHTRVVPPDKEADFQRDLLMLNSGLMTRKDFLTKHRPDIPEEQIDAYLAELAVENMRTPNPLEVGGNAGSVLL